MQGLGGYKQCQWLIDSGCTAVNDEICSDAKSSIKPEEVETLAIDGEPIFTVSLPYLYMLLNKPANHETSHKLQQYPNVFNLSSNHMRNIDMRAIGHLDTGTTRVLLITNDGQFNHRVTSSKHKVSKPYRITLKRAADNHLCEVLKSDILLHDGNETIATDEAVLEKPTVLLTMIIEGRCHQVKRMIVAVDNRVECLHHEKFNDWSADDLPSGGWKFVRVQEIFDLFSKFVKYSVFFVL